MGNTKSNQIPSDVILTSDQLKNVSNNDVFSYYAIATNDPMAKIQIDLPALQQCVADNTGADCIAQNIKGLDNTLNNMQPLAKASSNITVDSGGNINFPQNFQNINNSQNSQNPNCSSNALVLIVALIFILIIYHDK
jgi:hypothetical protein